MEVAFPLFQRKSGFSVSNLRCGKPLHLSAQRTAATCRTFSRENAKDWRFLAQKNRKKCKRGGATPPRVAYSAKICLARLFLRASETRDFGGSRIAVSRTRKPIQLDRSDWLFEPFGKVLGSRVEHSELPDSEVRKRRMDVLLQLPCYKGAVTSL